MKTFKANLVLVSLLPALWLGGSQATASDITPAGQRLSQTLDGMHVDELWLAGKQVDWRNGKPNGKVYAVPNGHTHCSAFAAAAAERLGVYLLHPPEHSSVLLANAQQDWLRSAGTNQGWMAVDSPIKAQELANEGELVVVTCKNPNPKSPGHIAIVRPSTRSDASIIAEGPEIIQAGLHNYVHGTVKQGFKNHGAAFANHELLYFAHRIPAASAQTGATVVNAARN